MGDLQSLQARLPVSESNVVEITSQVMDLGKTVQLNNSIGVLQLYDSSIFQMGGPGGVRHLPKPDFDGAYRYHIDGTLQIADKAAVKEMTTPFFPLKKALGQAKKALLTPLTGYWLKPCCDDSLHHLNDAAPTYLPALGERAGIGELGAAMRGGGGGGTANKATPSTPSCIYH